MVVSSELRRVGFVNEEGKSSRHLLETLDVNYIDMTPYIEESHYRDSIHLNAAGQRLYAMRFAEVIAKHVGRGRLAVAEPAASNGLSDR